MVDVHSTANKSSLDKHVRIVHQKERPFSCRVCDQTFGQKVHLDAHVSAVHVQVRTIGSRLIFLKLKFFDSCYKKAMIHTRSFESAFSV